MKGVFTISLDFELHWGGFEKWPLSKILYSKLKIDEAGTYNQYFLNTRQVVPSLLQLFANYGAHVTWASVGMLMHNNRESMKANSPGLVPTYKNPELSAYSFIEKEGIGDDEQQDPFHYADSLIRKIIATKHQELGSHTFSHFYCNEAGQTVEQFRADLQAAQRAASAYGKKLRSLVFPRNQFNDDYLRVCFEEGFVTVRSNPNDWFWHIESTQNEGAWKRLNRGLDAYFPVGRKNIYALDSIAIRAGLPICLPASRLLRPYRPSELFLNDLKIARIKSEIKQAAQANEVYHLWWHPHNFGWYPEQSLRGLEKILQQFQQVSNQFGMVSMSMGEIADSLVTANEKNKAA